MAKGFDQLLTRTVINSWWRWKTIRGEGSLDQTLLMKTFWRFMQSPKSQLQMTNMHHVEVNIEVDLVSWTIASWWQTLQQSLLQCACILDVFSILQLLRPLWAPLFPSYEALVDGLLHSQFLHISSLLVLKNPANSSPCWSATHQNKCRSVSCNFLWTFSCRSVWSSREELIACTSSMQFSYLPQVEAAADPQNN